MRRLCWLLWLLIALMPVRGIAQSLMVGGAFGHGATQAAASSAPCPMHAMGGEAAPAGHEASAANAADAAQPSEVPASVHVCNLCGVCHSAALPLELPLAQADTSHDAAPLPQLGLGAGRAAPSELFRPPR